MPFPTSGLIGHWQCNEGSGALAADSSGNGLDATVASGWSAAAPEGAACLDFNGSSDYAVVPYTAALYPAAAITLAARIYRADWSAAVGAYTGVVSTYNGFAFRFQAAVTSWDFGVMLNAGGVARSAVIADFRTLAAGWHEFIATYDGANLKFYVDGELEATTAASGSLTHANNSDLVIGAEAAPVAGDPPTQRFFNGRIDDVALWSVALSAEQLGEVYATPPVVALAPPLAVPLILVAPRVSPQMLKPPALALPLGLNAPRISPQQLKPPALALPLALLAPQYNPFARQLPGLALPLALSLPRGVAQISTAALGLPLALLAPGLLFNRSLSVPPLALQLSLKPPSWSWDIPSAGAWQQVYQLKLTGAADGLADVLLPLASFQSRVRLAGKTYLSAVVPYSAAVAEQILERPNGSLVIMAGIMTAAGDTTLTELLRGELGAPTTDLGPRSASITLTGYADQPAGAGITRTLSGVRSLRTGPTNQAQATIDLFLRPGDTASEPTTGTEIAVNLITYVYSERDQLMVVSDSGG